MNQKRGKNQIGAAVEHGDSTGQNFQSLMMSNSPMAVNVKQVQP